MAKNVTEIVSAAFPVVLPFSSAASTIVSTLVNMRLYAAMVKEMEEENRLLRLGYYNLDPFNTSPLLGCYFLLMADIGTLINYSVWDIGVESWMDPVAEMEERAEPVLDKAHNLIRASKYALSGTESLGRVPTWRDKWSS